MSNDNPGLKFRFLESSLEKLSSLQADPKTFLSGSPMGIILRNFGGEAKILGKTKFVAFGEENVEIKTGIKLVIPEGYCVKAVETSEILSTSLMLRPIVYDSSFTDEVTISFFNIGEREVLVPEMAILPVVLIAQPICKNPEVISDLEYLEAVPKIISEDSID